MTFEWDENKNQANMTKHGVSFEDAQYVFFDKNRIIRKDIEHSTNTEERFFCFGKTDKGIITVRFTIRKNNIRIFGAGLWREGRGLYEKSNKL